MTDAVPTSQPATLRDYVAILKRRKWIVVQAVVIVPLMAVLLTLLQDPVYEARSEVLLGRQNIGASLLGIADPTLPVDPQRLVQTNTNLARTPDVARRAVEAAQVDRGAGQLLGNSRVDAKPNADILEFSVWDGDPDTALKLANAYSHAFTEYRQELDTATIRQKRSELQERIQELRVDGQQQSDLYEQLVERDEQLGTLEVLHTPNRVIREAEGASQTEPQPRRNGLLGLGLGLVLGLGLAFLWEALDLRIRSGDEIERALGLPLLGRIPPPPKGAGGKRTLVMRDQPQSFHAEAFRLLRTNLDFENAARQAKTIMATSAAEDEGKSTTIANLALAMANAGRKVILVDLDLRQATLDLFFDLGGRPGVTEVIKREVDLETALTRIHALRPGESGLPGASGSNGREPRGTLEMLPAGQLPANPSAFLESPRLSELIDALAERADVVLVDAPPALVAGDALMLSSKVDAVLLVTRLDLLRRPMLKELVRTLRACPATNLGFVLTGVETESEYGYYGYGWDKARLAGAARAPAEIE